MICYTFFEIAGEPQTIPVIEEAEVRRKLVENLPKQGDEPGQRKVCFAQFHYSFREFIERNKDICKIYQAHEIATWFENKDNLSDAEKELFSIISQHVSVPIAADSASQDQLLHQQISQAFTEASS